MSQYFPALCRRVLNGDTSIAVSYVVFDLLGLDGTDLTQRPYEERRTLLEELNPEGPYWNITEVFDDGRALYDAVCALGLEGVVAKRTASRYGARRRWVKVKNPAYWRRDMEREAMQKSGERRRARVTRSSVRPKKEEWPLGTATQNQFWGGLGTQVLVEIGARLVPLLVTCFSIRR